MERRTEIVTVLINKHVTTNEFTSGCHWTLRKKAKDDVRGGVLTSRFRLMKTFDKPVSIHIFPLVKKGDRIFDSSNYSCMAKFLEDELVSQKVLVDDTNKYVERVCLEKAERYDKNGYLVVIREVVEEESLLRELELIE
ncbi:hypothetical protein A134_23055 [Vibrio crassostreae 9CS106]|uniref:Uncharacterized protein n=1 Tax=Vibrio crassostreae 9CS106 TaxID=1191300 RepID=A0A1B1C3A2_9VIBR|nr:hypothetical protein A134_23055 [Vibrio crassostreae 9CS106]